MLSRHFFSELQSVLVRLGIGYDSQRMKQMGFLIRYKRSLTKVVEALAVDCFLSFELRLGRQNEPAFVTLANSISIGLPIVHVGV